MYGGQCTEPFFHSALQTVIELQRAGISFDWLTERNESLVHRGRMEMVATFLRTKHSHLFWVDADIEFKPEHVAALWNLQTDIAVGLYSMKRPDMPLSAWKDGKLVRIENCPKEPFEVEFAGTGFMLISRKVIETLAEKVPSWEGANGPVPALFMTPIHNGCLESEDYYFCRIAREAGFKVIADPSIKLGHWGMTRHGAE
mgnify:CR=1 FL=1